MEPASASGSKVAEALLSLMASGDDNPPRTLDVSASTNNGQAEQQKNKNNTSPSNPQFSASATDIAGRTKRPTPAESEAKSGTAEGSTDSERELDNDTASTKKPPSQAESNDNNEKASPLKKRAGSHEEPCGELHKKAKIDPNADRDANPDVALDAETKDSGSDEMVVVLQPEAGGSPAAEAAAPEKKQEAPKNKKPDLLKRVSLPKKKPSRQWSHKRYCACNWEDCAEIAAQFAELEDPFQRGQSDFTEYMERDTVAGKAKKEAYVYYLGVSEERQKLPRYCVARHHFHPKQLTIIYENRMARATPVSRAMYLKTMEAGEAVDEKNLKGTFYHEKNEYTLFHYVPNYTRAQVLRDLKNLREEKVRKEERERQLKESQKRQARLNELQERRKRAASESKESPKKKASRLTNTAKASMIEELQSDLEIALAELEMKKGEVVQLKKQHAAEKKVALQQHLSMFQKHFQAEVHKLVQKHVLEKKELEKKKNELSSKLMSEHFKERNALNRKCTKLEQKYRETQEATNEYMFACLNDIVNDYGGLSRLTIFSDVWHEEHPDAAQHFFGFPTWNECKQRCLQLFPNEIGNAQLPKRAMFLNAAMSQKPKLVELSAFERCLMARMFKHCMPIRRRVARVFSITEAYAGKLINEWVPRWDAVKDELAVILRRTRNRQPKQPPAAAAAATAKSPNNGDGQGPHHHF